tara:strand:- start:278 stop:460 length:183 start_codon:yes stop_codon:yes gene_type:complete
LAKNKESKKTFKNKLNLRPFKISNTKLVIKITHLKKKISHALLLGVFSENEKNIQKKILK